MSIIIHVLSISPTITMSAFCCLVRWLDRIIASSSVIPSGVFLYNVFPLRRLWFPHSYQRIILNTLSCRLLHSHFATFRYSLTNCFSVSSRSPYILRTPLSVALSIQYFIHIFGPSRFFLHFLFIPFLFICIHFWFKSFSSYIIFTFVMLPFFLCLKSHPTPSFIYDPKLFPSASIHT